MLRNFKFLLLSAACVCMLWSQCYAYPCRSFDSKYLFENADLVCYGKVISLKAHQMKIEGKEQPVKGCLAKVEIISVIKGEAGAAIEVLFHADGLEQQRAYTTLAENEAAILFLKLSGGHYRFVDDDNSKLAVPAHKALEYKSKTPQGRLIEELIFATANDKGNIALDCIHELGNFQAAEAIARLKELSQSDDLATQGTAYASLVMLDEPPEAARLAAFFKRDYDPKSLNWSSHGNVNLTLGILNGMELRFNIIERDYGTDTTVNDDRGIDAHLAAEKWKTFDVVGFLTAILPEVSKMATYFPGCAEIGPRDVTEILGRQVDIEGRPAIIKQTFRPGSRHLAVQLFQNKELHVSHLAAIMLFRMGAEVSDESRSKFSWDENKAYDSDIRQWLEAHPDWLKNDK